MSTWRTPLVCTGLVTIAILLSLGSANSAYATDYAISDETSCKDLPGQGNNEIWNDLTSTCTKNSNLQIPAADTLLIPTGVTLEFSANRDLVNRGVIINNGIIKSTFGGDISNRESGTFTNSGTIEMNSILSGTARLQNIDSASFTNTISGIITIIGSNGQDGQLRNQDTSSFTNSGTITITGTSGNSGQLRNMDSSSFTNSGTITITGTSGNSGQLENEDTASFINSGNTNISSLIINLSVLTNSGFLTTNEFDNNNINSVISNSGSIQITLLLDNTGGLITNNCGEILFGSLSGNPIQEEECEILSPSGTSTAYEDPTIGKSRNGKQLVENGICIDINCWTVTADFHQDFELVELLSDSIHTITTTVFCQNGVNKCNYVAFGVSPYGTNINESVWKIILQKDHRDNWTMKVIDPNGYLGEVTSTTQIVNDNKHLAASSTIEFKKPTPGMILNVEVRDSGGGYRDFKFNDGVEIIDAYAYPSVETNYEPNLEIKPLCLNENPNKRYTCAFDKVRDWTIKNAEAALEQINK